MAQVIAGANCGTQLPLRIVNWQQLAPFARVMVSQVLTLSDQDVSKDAQSFPSPSNSQSTADTEYEMLTSIEDEVCESADREYKSCFYVPPTPPNVRRIYHNRKKTSYTEYEVAPSSCVKRNALIELLRSETSPAAEKVSRVAFAAGEADEDSSLEDVLELPDANGWQPLLIAAQRRQKGAVSALLQLGADVACRDPQSGWTPLMYAVSVGAAEIVQKLLHHGASIDEFAFPHDWNALCVAIHSNRADMVDMLLDAGADLDRLKKRHPCLAETYQAFRRENSAQ